MNTHRDFYIAQTGSKDAKDLEKSWRHNYSNLLIYMFLRSGIFQIILSEPNIISFIVLRKYIFGILETLHGEAHDVIPILSFSLW